MGAVPEFVKVSENPPVFAELVARKTSFGGLKNVIKLDVSEAEDTVTSPANIARPGTPKGPRLTHVPSPGTEQSVLVVQDLRVVQSTPRTR